MIQPARILVLATILMLAHLPLPWLHSHADMSTAQLASHLVQYHAGSSTSDSGGWHWHVFQYGQDGNTHLAAPPKECVADTVDSSNRHGHSLPTEFLPAIAIPSVAASKPAPRVSVLAVGSQRTYLRYHVLLN